MIDAGEIEKNLICSVSLIHEVKVSFYDGKNWTAHCPDCLKDIGVRHEIRGVVK